MFEHCNCFVVKVTRDCNLRCKYCYIENKDKYKDEVMSFETFKKLIDRIIEDKLKIKSRDSFSFIFHGGEPTIIGYDKFKLFASYARREFTKAHLNFNFGIQTNGTLLDDDFLILFHDFQINPGLSFDGPSGESNSNRLPGIESQNFYKELTDRLKRFHIEYGHLAVISKKNADYTLENMESFQKDYSLKQGKWNFCEDVLNSGDNIELTGEEFFNKVALPLLNAYPGYQESNLSNLIELYFKDKICTQNNDHFENRNLLGNCGVKFCGGGKNVLEISPDGKINYCGRYSRDDEISECNDIKNKDFLGVISRKKYYEHIVIKDRLIRENHCDLCFAGDLCDYGCMAFSYAKLGRYTIRKELVCSYYKLLKKYFVQHEDDLFEKYFDSHKNEKNALYIRLKQEVSTEYCRNIERQCRGFTKNRFAFIPDPEFTSSDGKNYQIKIYRI